MPTIKNHNNKRAVRQRTAEGANHWVNSKDRNAPITAVEKTTTNYSRASCYIRSRMTSPPHRLKKTSSMQPKRRDYTWLHRETNEKLSCLKCLANRHPEWRVVICCHDSFDSCRFDNIFNPLSQTLAEYFLSHLQIYFRYAFPYHKRWFLRPPVSKHHAANRLSV